MRVLHVIARMNVGGTATYLHSLISGLDESGVDELLAVGNVPPNEREDSRLGELKFKRVLNMSRRLSFAGDIRAYKELRTLVGDFKPDLIHSHTFKAGLLSRVKNFGVPTVHTFHGHHLYDPEFGWVSRKVMNFIEKVLAKRSRKLLTIGTKVGKELLEAGIGSSSQFISIPPGIEELGRVDQRATREKFGIAESAFVVVWLGRFTRVKRPDLVLEVAKLLPEMVFVMAGDGELLDEVRGAAPSNLKIVGVQSAAEMWGIADVGLLTSDSEGMPLSVIEAQMCGVPVVATDVGSVSEIVEDGVSGKLVSGTSTELAAAISSLLDSPSTLQSMGEAAMKRARKLFSREVMVNRHLEVYEEILGKVSK